MVRAVAIRALESLPGDRTLGLAQDWLDSEVWGRRRAAEGILAAHGTPEDAERIRAALREPLARQDEYRACNLVEALGRLPEVAPFPEIEEVFEQTTYSLCRLRAAKALAATSPEFAGGRAVECLWDCDDETRQIGCQYVELSVRGVRERLDELSGDTLEEEEVRTAARRRVAE